MESALKATLRNGQFEKWTATRSRLMSRIRSRGTKSTETVFRMVLVRLGIKGWMLHPQGLSAKPDVYFPQLKLAIFVDGCFWHCCPRCGHTPKTNQSFWALKLRLTKQRDRKDAMKLRRRGVQVLRIWEHELSVINRTRLYRRLLTKVKVTRKSS